MSSLDSQSVDNLPPPPAQVLPPAPNPCEEVLPPPPSDAVFSGKSPTIDFCIDFFSLREHTILKAIA